MLFRSSGTRVQVNGSGSTVQICTTDGSQTAWWEFDKTGKLTAPGEIWTKSGDGINGIAFSPNGTDMPGYIKVDGGSNMVAGASGNFSVKSFNHDRIYITDTDSTFSATRDVKLTAETGNVVVNAQGAIWHFASAEPGEYHIEFPNGRKQVDAWTGNIDTAGGYINFTASPAVGTSGIT